MYSRRCAAALRLVAAVFLAALAASGGFLAAFVFSMLISVGGYFAELEWGYVLAFVVFIAIMFARPQGLLARKS